MFSGVLCRVQGSQKLKLTFQEKEDLLARLVNERWLAKHPQRRGHYSIGVRLCLPPIRTSLCRTDVLHFP